MVSEPGFFWGGVWIFYLNSFRITHLHTESSYSCAIAMGSAETGFGGAVHSPVESWTPAKPADWIVWGSNAEPAREDIYQDRSGDSGPPSPTSATPAIVNIASAPSMPAAPSVSPASPFSRPPSRVTSREGVVRRSYSQSNGNVEAHALGDLHDNPIFRRRSNESFELPGVDFSPVSKSPSKSHRSSVVNGHRSSVIGRGNQKISPRDSTGLSRALRAPCALRASACVRHRAIHGLFFYGCSFRFHLSSVAVATVILMGTATICQPLDVHSDVLIPLSLQARPGGLTAQSSAPTRVNSTRSATARSRTTSRWLTRVQ